MNALLLVAHGSRRDESNNEIRALTKALAPKVVDQFDLVECAFLELAIPFIPQGIQALVDQGASYVQVLPYFLARGTHVAKDIPREVAKARVANPNVTVVLTDYLGASDSVANVLRDIAVSTLDDSTS